MHYSQGVGMFILKYIAWAMFNENVIDTIINNTNMQH